ncbi:MAG: hypothetical protein Q7W29_03100 [bacterium]|nr:hypothetical protein [bacterium]
MQRIDRAMLVLAIVGGASAAVAQDAPRAQETRPAQPVELIAPRASGAPGTTAPADPVAGVADIPENQAELQALSSGGQPFAPPEGATLGVAPTSEDSSADEVRTARRVAFESVVAEQDTRIATLAARLRDVAGTEESLAVQREIEQLKRSTGLRLLELQLEMARTDGDADRAAGIEAAIAAWDAPHPAPQPVERPTPVAPRR